MNHDVMVVDANALAMIAVIRSLGRAGYRPHAVSPRYDALGFKSRFTVKHSVHPGYDSPRFIPWLQNYVDANAVRAIVCGEEFLHAIDGKFNEFEELIPDAPSPAIRQLCLSKARVWNHLMSDTVGRSALPESGVFRNSQDIETVAASAGRNTTVYLKMDSEYRRTKGESSRVVRLRGPDEMRTVAAEALKEYSALFWQQEVRGLQVGVSLWRHNGEVVAENMVLGLHLYPYHAGNMSLRKTWWHERLLNDAKTKLNALNWSGVAMMEYIWNPESDEFWFIEMNPRYWGYLHLDLVSGKDFPKWQLDAHFGEETVNLGPPNGVYTLRYAPGEILHVASRCLASGIPMVDKLKSLGEFLTLSFNPGIHADLWFDGDRFLYLHGWLRFARELPARIVKMFKRKA